MNTLSVVNLAKKYGHKNVLIDISLKLKSGEVLGLLGPNGAGKTTCFYSILGLIAPDNGSIFLNEKTLPTIPFTKEQLKELVIYHRSPQFSEN